MRALNATNNIRCCAIEMIVDVRVDLGLVTEVRETTKGQVPLLRAQRILYQFIKLFYNKINKC